MQRVAWCISVMYFLDVIVSNVCSLYLQLSFIVHGVLEVRKKVKVWIPAVSFVVGVKDVVYPSNRYCVFGVNFNVIESLKFHVCIVCTKLKCALFIWVLDYIVLHLRPVCMTWTSEVHIRHVYTSAHHVQYFGMVLAQRTPVQVRKCW